LSRRALLAISATALAGTAVSIAAAAAPADAGGDEILMETWAKYQAAEAHNDTLEEKIHPLFEAALAALPPHMERAEFERLTEEEHEGYRRQRTQEFKEAFDKHGVTTAQREQQHFLDTVLFPLERTMIDTAPTTLKGVSIKAAYLLDHAQLRILDTDRPEDLDFNEQALRKFIEQLADLPAEEGSDDGAV
jgi:hypothetical protein